MLRHAALERAERGRHRQRRDAPAHGRDALVVHVLEQTLRRHEKFLRDDGRRRAEAQRQVNVAHGGDVVQRRLVAEYVLARDAHHAGVVLDVAHERVLRRDDALGRAGRAGGEDDVQRVELTRARAAVRQQRRVLAALEQILRDEDLAAEFQRPGLVVKRALHDHQIGVERVQDRIEPVHGHRPVHRCVAAAGVYRAEKYGRGVCVAPAHHGDGRLASAAQPCRRRADDARLAPHVGKGHRAVLVKKGGLVRTGCGGGFQPVEHVCIHACSSFLLSIHNRQLSYHVSQLKTSKIGTVLRKGKIPARPRSALDAPAAETYNGRGITVQNVGQQKAKLFVSYKISTGSLCTLPPISAQKIVVSFRLVSAMAEA